MAARRKDLTISLKIASLGEAADDTIAIGIPKNDTALRRALRGVGSGVVKLVRHAVERGAFSGEPGATACLCPEEKGAPSRVVLVGLGSPEEIDAERIRLAAGAAVKRARQAGARSVSIGLFPGRRISAEDRARAMAEGLTLGVYGYDRYRTDANDSKPPIKRATIVAPEAARGLQAAVRRGRLTAEATNFTRDLSNTAPNDMPPAALATEARRLARSRELSCKVLNRAEIVKTGMRALLAVGQGSANDPRFIHLEYDPGRRARRTIALVGKGITFDTGGISLKPWSGMWDMKFDKCGATAVLGAIRAAADMKLPVRVIALVAAAENMPSRDAYRPGDVISTYSGKTVEVHSTDAEGRLVLADALHYATKRKPDAIIDVATLTGACVVALGHLAAGLFSNDDALADAIGRAADASGESVWRLPIFPQQRKRIDSKVADMKNVGGRPGGAITAACFLQEFVGDTPWAHLDIAGMSDTQKTSGTGTPGATGFGARLLARFLEDCATA